MVSECSKNLAVLNSDRMGERKLVFRVAAGGWDQTVGFFGQPIQTTENLDNFVEVVPRTGKEEEESWNIGFGIITSVQPYPILKYYKQLTICNTKKKKKRRKEDYLGPINTRLLSVMYY